MYKIGVISLMLVGAVCAVLFLANINETIVDTPIVEHGRFKPFILRPVGDADPGSGASGWLNISAYYNETGDPANYYARNLTNNASSYAWTNTNNTHSGSDVPHNVEHALVFKIRVNVSDGYSSGNSTWMPTWFVANVTSGIHGVVNATMTRYTIGSNSTYMWLHFVYQGGLTINPGQNISTCQVYSYKWE